VDNVLIENVDDDEEEGEKEGKVSQNDKALI